MYINTRMPNLTNVSVKALNESMVRLKYLNSIDEKDTPEMVAVRKKILKKLKTGQPFDELEVQFNELKEQQFVKEHGMGTKEYERKIEEEQFLLETVPVRECLCGDCRKSFDSDRLHPNCSHCGGYQYFALERDIESNLIGKVIKSIFRSPEEELIIFTDGTYRKNNIGGFC
jgi:hypothetical protein